MKILAKLKNSGQQQTVLLKTNDNEHSLDVPVKKSGSGSAVNGGEMLFLALATCYCNDLYREAAKRNIVVTEVEVTVDGDFGSEGEPASNVTYRAKIRANAMPEEIEDLMRYTDRMTEIQNTLRRGTKVELIKIEAVSAK